MSTDHLLFCSRDTMENRSLQENLISFLDEIMWLSENNKGINIIHSKLYMVFNLVPYDFLF